MSTSYLNRLGEIDFSRTIERLAEGFTGREWLFTKLDNWLSQENGEQFYLLTGEPGVGKSAIAAQLTQRWADENTETGKLAAYHFCRAGDVETVRPGRVLRSLATQLVKMVPNYGEALEQVIDPVFLKIKVDIEIGTLSNSQVTGIYVENLKDLDPREEFRLLIQAPLVALSKIYKESGNTPPPLKVFLIDSLDEAATTTGQANMVTLLASLYQARETLPPWVRFLLTARPDRTILNQFFPLQSEKIEELEEDNLSDIKQYIKGRVNEGLPWKLIALNPQSDTEPVPQTKPLQERLEEANVTPENLVKEIKDLSHGNFLYTKLLLNSIAAGEQSIKNLSALPKNLNEVYHRILRYRCSYRGWSKRYQPILGTLSATQEPISQAQLSKFIGINTEILGKDLAVFQQFLDESEDEQGQHLYAIFHQSLREYLLDKERNHDFWCDVREEHERIVEFYRNNAESWDEVKWNEVDAYGLKHLAKHIYNQVNLSIIENRSRKEIDRYRKELYELICQAFMQAKLVRSESHQSFAEDVELAISLAADKKNPDLVQLIRGYYLSAKLNSQSASLPPKALGGYAKVGKHTKASGYAALIQDSYLRSEAYRLITEAVLQKNQLSQVAKEYLDKAVAAAEQASSEDKVMALSNIALVLANAEIHLEAEEIFERSVTAANQIKGKNGIELLSNLAQILAIVGYFNKALTVAEGINDASHKAKALSKIAFALAQKEQQMQSKNIPLESPSGLVNRLCAMVRLIFRLESEKQTQNSREGKDDKNLQMPKINALEIFEQAIQTASHNPESVESLSLEVKEYPEYSESQRQMAIMRSNAFLMMDVNKHLPKQSIVQLKIAQDLARAKENTKAYELLEKAVSINILDPWYKFAIDIDVALLASLWGKYAVAAEIFKEIEDGVEGLRSVNNSVEDVLDRIAQALLETGQLDEAIVVAKKINDSYRKAPLLSKIAHAKFQANELIQALEVFELAIVVANEIEEDVNSRFNILNIIAENLASVKQFNLAISIANNITSNKHKIIVLGTIAYALAHNGRNEEALALLEQSVALSEQTDNTHNKPQNMVKIAKYLSITGKQAQAAIIYESGLSLVEKIEEDEKKASAWSSIAQSLAQAGQFDRAESVVMQIEKLDGQGVVLLEALESMIQVLIEARQFNKARELAEKIWLEGRRAVVISRIAHFLDKEGQPIESEDLFKQAIVIAENITYRDSKIEALSLVARSIAETGQLTRASQIFDQAVAIIEDYQQLDDKKAQALSKVALAMAEAGQQTKSLEIFNQAINIFHQIGKDPLMANETIDFPKKLDALSAIVQDLTLAQDHPRAAKLFKDALPETIEFLNKDLQFKSLYIQRIFWAAWHAVQSLVLIGHFEEAIAVAVQMEQIAGDRGKARILDGIAQALIKTQKFEQAIEIVKQISNSQDRMETLVKAAHLFEEQGTYSISLSDLQNLFKVAQSTDTESVFGVLAGIASYLANIDQGHILWDAYEEVTKIDDWRRN